MKGILDSIAYIGVGAYSPCQPSLEAVIHRFVDDSMIWRSDLLRVSKNKRLRAASDLPLIIVNRLCA